MSDTNDFPAPVRIHLTGGQQIDTTIDEEDLDSTQSTTLEDHIEHVLSTPPKPHWCWLGAAHVFTQALASVEIL